MFYNAESHKFQTGDTYIDYLTFGKGKKPLVIIPGLNTSKIGGMAVPMALMYRRFARDYKVYFIDRKADIPEGYTIEQMAWDTAEVMDSLGIKKACITGVSQGGMIAQRIAVFRPDLVDRLVLAVTASRTNAVTEKVLTDWIEMAEKQEYKEFTVDMLSKLYTPAYVSRYKLFIPLLTAFQKPENNKRFIRQSQAILKFDMYMQLDKIKCPVLVIAGAQDKVTSVQASQEIADRLNCDIYIYENYGHAVYDEQARDFNERIYKFLNRKL